MSDLDYDAEPEVEQHPLLDQLDQGNLVEVLKSAKHKDATDAHSRIMGLYADAVTSMSDWKKKYKEALWLAKLEPYANGVIIDKKTFPFDGASMDMLPNVLEAMLDFSSRASPELVWARDIVKAKVYGQDKVEAAQPGPDGQQAPPQEALKQARARRVSTYSNYQLREEIPHWTDDQDKLLMALPCVGTVFKEGYFDGDEEVVCSDMLHADEVIFDHKSRHFDQALDKFIELKLSRNDVIGYIRGEQKWDYAEDKLETDKNEFEFIKAYSWIDLDDDGIREPYIAILEKEHGKIIYLQPNYDDDTISTNEDGELVKIKPNIRFTQYRFLPDPQGGPMGLGWGILMGPAFASLNTMLRQMIDAGTLQNAASNSGLIELDSSTGRGNAVQAGIVEVIMGQLTPVNTRGSRPLSDSIHQFPASGPSQGLFQLMDHLSEALRRITTASSQIEANTNEAATLYLARLQQALKTPNSIIMRVYKAAGNEFKVIFDLNSKYYDDDTYNRVLDEDTDASMQKDFDPSDCDIRLVADPTQGSDIERSARSEAVLQEAKTQPAQVLNLRQAYRNWLIDMKHPDIDGMLPKPQLDPMMELMRMEKQMDAEFRKKEIELREGELVVKQAKAANEAAKSMAELGLADDEMIAKTTEIYAKALKSLVDAGLSPQQGLKLMNGEDAYLGNGQLPIEQKDDRSAQASYTVTG